MHGMVIDAAALVLATDDTVATALEDCEAGRRFAIDKEDLTVEIESITLTEDVPFGHKFALTTIDTGEDIYKYGHVIGRATEPIDAGEWVHTHNCESTRGRGDVVAAGGDAE